MRHDLTDISIVLDRSGSMSTVCTDTIGGFNTFIQKQRDTPGECNVSLVQFNELIETLYSGRKVKEAPLLSGESFVPRGLTALLDAIGHTITTTGSRLGALPEDQRPAKVLFVILTDGAENASKEYTREKVLEMIAHQNSIYQWEFIFLGANQDAIKSAATLGIGRGSAMSYAANSVGTRNVFASVAAVASAYRGGGSATFTDKDRDAQTAAGAPPAAAK